MSIQSKRINFVEKEIPQEKYAKEGKDFSFLCRKYVREKATRPVDPLLGVRTSFPMRHDRSSFKIQ